MWATDEEHAPLYWFPRDCPRITFWAGPETPAESIRRFLGETEAHWVHAIEAGWSEWMRTTTLFVYRLGSSLLHPPVAERARATPDRVEMNGWVSPLLQIRFEVQDLVLRVYDPQGRLFLSPEEYALQAAHEQARADQERARADQERARADQERARADQERARAERLAARLRESGLDEE